MSKKNSSGFTLIEVMVAMVILTIISLQIWQTSAVSMNAKERYELEDIRFHEVAMALARIADDLTMAYLYVSEDHLGNTGVGEPIREIRFVGKDSGERDELHFAAFSNFRYLRSQRASDQEEVSYFLRQGEENDRREVGSEWNLVRRSQSPPDREPEEGGQEYVLLEEVTELAFQFYNEKRGEWLKDWDSAQIEFNKTLPKAVEITITIPDPLEPDEKRSFTTTALLEMAPGPNDF